VEVGLDRARRRIEDTALAGREDRFEQQALAFHQKVRKGYLELAAQNPARFRILDATMELERLHEEIVTILEPYLDQEN
jgi:dTMP kinase